MFVEKPNQSVHFVYKKYKNINDPYEVMIHYDINCKEKLDENILRCIISFIQTEYSDSNYFRFLLDIDSLIIHFFHRRKMRKYYIKYDNIFFYKNMLYMKFGLDEEFDKMKDRIQKITKFV